MREILFKAKRIDNGEWVEGFFYSVTRGAHRNPIENTCEIMTFQKLDNGEVILTSVYDVIPETLGQFTGLTDKNGKKIFEGDILNENGYHFTVAFDEIWAKFKLQHDGHAIQYPEWNRGIQMEIIGSIHDNPELLNQKEAVT